MEPTAPTYRERLHVPVSYWLIGLAFGLTFVVALGSYLGPRWGLAIAVTILVVVGGGLIAYGRARIEVGDAGLVADRGHIDWGHVGVARALDPTQTHARLGTAADPAAYLVTRPFLPSSVEVGIADPADPHPYWLLSSRHPADLAAAINARAAGA